MAKDDEESDAWGSQLDGKESARAGLNKETLRKSLQLNPNLRKGLSTVDAMNQLEAASLQRNTAKAQEGDAAPSRPPPRDLVEAIANFKQRFHEEKKRTKEEMAKLQQVDRELGPKVLERVLDTILDIDPNMVALPTQEMVRTEMGFLNEIGFSAKKLNERKLSKKKI